MLAKMSARQHSCISQTSEAELKSKDKGQGEIHLLRGDRLNRTGPTATLEDSCYRAAMQKINFNFSALRQCVFYLHD
jgi:hypothetical protein